MINIYRRISNPIDNDNNLKSIVNAYAISTDFYHRLTNINNQGRISDYNQKEDIDKF